MRLFNNDKQKYLSFRIKGRISSSLSTKGRFITSIMNEFTIEEDLNKHLNKMLILRTIFVFYCIFVMLQAK